MHKNKLENYEEKMSPFCDNKHINYHEKNQFYEEKGIKL